MTDLTSGLFVDIPVGVLSEGTGSLLGGVLLVVYAAITSLRKRRDVSITELLKRIADLEKTATKREEQHAAEVLRLEADIEDRDRDIESLEARVAAYQAAQIVDRREKHQLRLTLADHGIPDPTDPKQP